MLSYDFSKDTPRHARNSLRAWMNGYVWSMRADGRSEYTNGALAACQQTMKALHDVETPEWVFAFFFEEAMEAYDQPTPA